MKQEIYEVYTDGACSGNPGPGGYAFTIISEGKTFLNSWGFEPYTTNNAMELTAIVKSLLVLVKEAERKGRKFIITVYSDSSYCINPINQKWIYSWMIKNWKTSENKEVKNKELWQEVFRLINNNSAQIEFIKIKGHSGNLHNEFVDRMAKKAIEENRFKTSK